MLCPAVANSCSFQGSKEDREVIAEDGGSFVNGPAIDAPLAPIAEQMRVIAPGARWENEITTNTGDSASFTDARMRNGHYYCRCWRINLPSRSMMKTVRLYPWTVSHLRTALTTVAALQPR